MGLGTRNEVGLDEQQVRRCLMWWEALTAAQGLAVALVIDPARDHLSATAFRESDGRVYLGANVYPGRGASAEARLSGFACLAHELAHAERRLRGFDRPTELPDLLIDEAETSLHASFYEPLGPTDRADLIEHARDHTMAWLARHIEGRKK